MHYERSVVKIMLVALISITSEQANLMNIKINKLKKFLHHAASHQYVIVMLHASGMVLAYHSNALYLREPKTRIQVGGNVFLISE